MNRGDVGLVGVSEISLGDQYVIRSLEFLRPKHASESKIAA
jgi:hypothetical protein